MVDIEADGPIPGKYSMIEIGAVIVTTDKTFYGKLKPISDKWVPEALAVTGYTREQTLAFEDPFKVMNDFKLWIEKNGWDKPRFISDNNGFDWMFVCWYFHNFLNENPFGYSSTNLGSLYKGIQKNFFVNFKHLRGTKHTHNPVDDAMGNSEAFIKMMRTYNVKGDL